MYMYMYMYIPIHICISLFVYSRLSVSSLDNIHQTPALPSTPGVSSTQTPTALPPSTHAPLLQPAIAHPNAPVL